MDLVKGNIYILKTISIGSPLKVLVKELTKTTVYLEYQDSNYKIRVFLTDFKNRYTISEVVLDVVNRRKELFNSIVDSLRKATIQGLTFAPNLKDTRVIQSTISHTQTYNYV